MLGKFMIDRLLAWLKDEGQDLSQGDSDVQLAVAALLLEAAVAVDGLFDERERAIVGRLLEQCFHLSHEDAQQLLGAAQQRIDGSAQLFGFTRAINRTLARERKVEVIEMLWEVAYADGQLDPLEDSLLRRIGGLIASAGHSGSHTPQSMHSSGWMTNMLSPS